MNSSKAVNQLHALWKSEGIMPDGEKDDMLKRAAGDYLRLRAALQWISDEASIHAEDPPQRIRDIRAVALAAIVGCEKAAP